MMATNRFHKRAKSPAGLLSCLLAVCLFAPPHALANQNLEKCFAAEQEFDYQLVLAECAIAAQDNSLNQDNKTQVYRLLGVAHTALGDMTNAEFWFIKVLILDAQFTFPEDESPVYIEAFEKAKQKFASEGAVVITHLAPVLADGQWPEEGVIPVQFEVKDAFGRVENASLMVVLEHEGQELAKQEKPLKRLPNPENKTLLFSGELDQPRAADAELPETFTLRYTLVMTNAFGAEISSEPSFEPVLLHVQSDGSGGGSGLLWAGAGGVLAIGAGTALILGASGGFGLYCYVSGNCVGGSPPASPHSELEVSISSAVEGQ